MAAVPISNAIRWAAVITSVVYSNWDSIKSFLDRAAETPTTPPILGYYSTFSFDYLDTVSGAWGVERGQFGVHWVNTTGGDLDYTWTTADFTAAETVLKTFWAACAPYFHSGVRSAEMRWYPYGPNVHAPNPAYRITSVGTPVAGGTSTYFPRQCANAITFKTAMRKHWGRVYVPFSGGTVDQAGRTANLTCDNLAIAGTNLAHGDTSAGVFPCVYDRTHQALWGINRVQVDNTADVIRRRRPKHSTYKKEIVVT
jgi:hypothetical protein